MYMLQVLTIVYCCNSNVFIVLIGMFYFTFGNKFFERSKLFNIHLVVTARTALLKKYSMNKIIQPIVKELKILVSYKHRQIMTLNIFITGEGLDLGGGEIIK